MHRQTVVQTLRTGLGSFRQSAEAALPRSDQYRRFARECLEMADEATDRRLQAIMLHMAQVWLRLAQEHEAEHEAGHDAEHEAPDEQRWRKD